MLRKSRTCILGSWSTYARKRKNLDLLIHEAVTGALQRASVELAQVDCVVTVSSDTVDGAIAPLLRSEASGARGRDYLHVTGASAAAMDAAMTLIKARLARNVLVVGWGEWTKKVVDQVPDLETDPVFHRPIGIGSLQLASMQLGWLVDRGLVSRSVAIAFAHAMRARRVESDELAPVRTRRLAAPKEAQALRLCRELMPDGVDRATAVLLSSAQPASLAQGIWIQGVATRFRPLWPEQEDLDPAVWVAELLAQCRLNQADLAGLAIEISSTNAVIGLRAANALGGAGDWSKNRFMNRFGGGLAAYNGAADGLARIDLLARACSVEAGMSAPRDGLVIELAGPIGQATASMHLTRRG